MQVQQSGVSVNSELIHRLKIGGRWYGPGSVVAIDQTDFDILEMRGIARRAKPSAKPLNIEEKKPEVIKASEVPVQTKDEGTNEEQHGTHKSDRKRR